MALVTRAVLRRHVTSVPFSGSFSSSFSVSFSVSCSDPHWTPFPAIGPIFGYFTLTHLFCVPLCALSRQVWVRACFCSRSFYLSSNIFWTNARVRALKYNTYNHMHARYTHVTSAVTSRICRGCTLCCTEYVQLRDHNRDLEAREATDRLCDCEHPAVLRHILGYGSYEERWFCDW
jgi:hypothetical protein